MHTIKENDEPRSPYERLMNDVSIQDGQRQRLSQDRKECQLIPLKEAVNLRQKELLALAAKEGRTARWEE